MKHVTTKFNEDVFKNAWSKAIVIEQTKRLEKYAQKELSQMAGNHEFRNRTYNLQDSLCWILFYNGEKRSYGFYGGGRASEASVLHAWGNAAYQKEINGRELAQSFVDSYTPTVQNGWEVVWASVAPYGSYLEQGKTPMGIIFRVITQEYDNIKKTLKTPCVVTVEINPVIS